MSQVTNTPSGWATSVKLLRGQGKRKSALNPLSFKKEIQIAKAYILKKAAGHQQGVKEARKTVFGQNALPNMQHEVLRWKLKCASLEQQNSELKCNLQAAKEQLNAQIVRSKYLEAALEKAKIEVPSQDLQIELALKTAVDKSSAIEPAIYMIGASILQQV